MILKIHATLHNFVYMSNVNLSELLALFSSFVLCCTFLQKYLLVHWLVVALIL